MKTNERDKTLFSVDYDILLQIGLTINQYFFLWMIDNGDVSLYRLYLEQFPSPVNKLDLETLINKDLIDLKNKTREGILYTFENIKTTNHYKELFEKKINNAIEELQLTYPKKTPFKKRRLQSDPDKWRPKYLSIIKGKPELHQTILQCIQAESVHRKKTNSEEFWPLLTTYINNKRWEDYEDDIGEVREEVTKDYDI